VNAIIAMLAAAKEQAEKSAREAAEKAAAKDAAEDFPFAAKNHAAGPVCWTTDALSSSTNITLTDDGTTATHATSQWNSVLSDRWYSEGVHEIEFGTTNVDNISLFVGCVERDFIDQVAQAEEVVRVAEPDLAEDDPVQVAAVHKAEADRREDEVLVGAEDRIDPRLTAPKTVGIAAAQWPHAVQRAQRQLWLARCKVLKTGTTEVRHVRCGDSDVQGPKQS